MLSIGNYVHRSPIACFKSIVQYSIVNQSKFPLRQFSQSSSSNTVHVYNVPGTVPYDVAWDWQQKLHKKRMRNPDLPDILLLLEHDPVYTLGRGSTVKNILFDYDPEKACEFEVRRVERGGQVTYHGPGQVVGYPILNLKRPVYKQDLHWYLRQVEETMIQTLGEYDLEAHRVDEYTGVWAGNVKLAAIGLSVSKWVTMHGFALNVNPDLKAFDRIIPCGIDESEKGVSSLANECPKEKLEGIGIDSVRATILKNFANVFEVELNIIDGAPPAELLND